MRQALAHKQAEEQALRQVDEKVRALAEARQSDGLAEASATKELVRTQFDASVKMC